MATRSPFVSLALLVLPSLILSSFRLLSPEFSNALSNDPIVEISSHSIALAVGVIATLRYRFVEDHEYHRSKAIGRLSRTYRMEDKGLWEKGDSAIERLEAKAFSDFKGKGASIARRRMHSSIGEINRESAEIEQSREEQSQFSIIVDGVEQNFSDKSQMPEKKKGLFSRWSEFILDSVERTAIKRSNRSANLEKSSENSTFLEKSHPSDEALWDIEAERPSSPATRLCNGCGSYNYLSSNYCSSCGSYIE